MVFMLVFIEDFETKIYSLIAMQVLRVNYAYWIRSFNMMKDQIVEILSEVVYLVLMVLLTQYTDNEKWTKTATYVFIGIIFSYIWILLFLSIYTLSKFILGIGIVRKLLRRIKILLIIDRGSKESKPNIDSGGRTRQIFSEISFSIQHNQDSFRVEKMYSFDLSDDQSF